MLRIGAVDCEEFSQICSKEGVTEFPTYRVYPPFPVPPQDLKSGDKELDTDVLKKMCFKHIGNRAIEITAQNHDVFKTDNPGKPKVLLFTDKQKFPIVFRALSTYFDVSSRLKLLLSYVSIWFPSPFLLYFKSENPRVRHGQIRGRHPAEEVQDHEVPIIRDPQARWEKTNHVRQWRLQLQWPFRVH